MITLLLGTNTYARNKSINSLASDYEQLVQLDGKQLDKARLIQELAGQSLFGNSSLIVVRNMGDNKSLANAIDDILASVGEGNGLAIIEDKLDKRTSYYKTLKKQAEVIVCDELKHPEAVDFVIKYASRCGASLSRSAAEHLVNKVGLDQQLLASETKKLSIQGQPITVDRIDELSPSSLEDSAFALTDALAAGQTERAIDTYRQLRLSGVQPPELIGVLAWQLHVLAQIVASGTSNQQAVASESGLHPFVVKKNWQLASGLDIAQIRQMVDRMLEADLMTKSSKVPNDEVVEQLLLELSELLAAD